MVTVGPTTTIRADGFASAISSPSVSFASVVAGDDQHIRLRRDLGCPLRLSKIGHLMRLEGRRVFVELLNHRPGFPAVIRHYKYDLRHI